MFPDRRRFGPILPNAREEVKRMRWFALFVGDPTPAEFDEECAAGRDPSGFVQAMYRSVTGN